MSRGKEWDILSRTEEVKYPIVAVIQAIMSIVSP
jgi:hypothetical protein